MATTQNGPVRPPLKPPPAPLPKGSGFEQPAPTPPGDWRDPEIFGPLNARVEEEKQRERGAQIGGRVKRRSLADAAPPSNTPARARRRRRANAPIPKAPASPAFAASKEKAMRAASDIRRKFGEVLSREDSVRLANAFRSAIVPRRKAGRRPKPQVTAAYLDWKAGLRGVALFRKHIPGWEGHHRYHKIGEQKELMDAIRSRRRRDSPHRTDNRRRANA